MRFFYFAILFFLFSCNNLLTSIDSEEASFIDSTATFVSPVFWAAKPKLDQVERRYEKMQLLKKDINSVHEEDGQSGLMMAVKHIEADQIDVIEYLIEKGADVNLQDNKGNTALIYAVQYQKTADIVYLLIEAGAKADVKNEEGCTAVSYCLTSNYLTPICSDPLLDKNVYCESSE